MAEKRRGKGCFKRKDTWCADCTVCCVYINALLLPLTIFFFLRITNPPTSHYNVTQHHPSRPLPLYEQLVV